MKILISVNHPAHVHLFKNLIWKMEKNGHEFCIVARNKDKTIDLLDEFGFRYELIGNAETTVMGYIFEMVKRTKKFFLIIGDFKPDLVVTQMDPSPAIAAKLRNVPYICLADSEPAKIILRSTLPFSETVLTPACFRTNLGEKQIKYFGYKELAYLHPNSFQPDSSILSELGLKIDDPFILVRFVAWRAHHDIGQTGILNKNEIIDKLKIYGRIFISSESRIEDDLKDYELKISPDKMHDLLYFSRLFFCDSQTMATEAGILGTPTIRCNSFAGKDDMGNFIELENTYNLIYNFNNELDAVKKAEELLKIPNLKDIWADKRNRLLHEKIDLTSFLIWLFENYPTSIDLIKKNPEIQNLYKKIS